MCTNNYIVIGLAILLICLFMNMDKTKDEGKKCNCGK